VKAHDLAVARDLAAPAGALIPPPIPKFFSVERVDDSGEALRPEMFTGFVGHLHGGEPASFPVDFMLSETVDFLHDLGIKGLAAPRPAPLDPVGAREAQAIMDSTSILHGAATAIFKETDERIVLPTIDRLVQQMVGWRETTPVAPGLPALAIPPRSEPEGWHTDSGIIQKRAAPLAIMEPWFWDFSMPMVYYERISYYDSFAQRRRDDAVFEWIVKASDCRVDPVPEKRKRRRAS
jgi:hypothetical protein